MHVILIHHWFSAGIVVLISNVALQSVGVNGTAADDKEQKPANREGHEHCAGRCGIP